MYQLVSKTIYFEIEFRYQEYWMCHMKLFIMLFPKTQNICLPNHEKNIQLTKNIQL
jgi:hypothetical protein